MKTRVQFGFDLGRERHDEVVQILIDAGCAEEYMEYGGPDGGPAGTFWHTFDSEDPRLETLRCLLSERGDDWVERHDAKYTVAELKEFPLLALCVLRSPVRHGGGKYGTEYDFSNACPECGSGAVQTSPLILPAHSVPADWQVGPAESLILTTDAGEILVSDLLAGALREASVSGLELRQVISRKRRKPLPWWQIVTSHEMPGMAPETQGVVRESCWTALNPTIVFPPPCEHCMRDGHYSTIAEPLQIVYHRTDVDLASIPDVVHTWELFGQSVRTPNQEEDVFPGYAQPLILVKQNVFNIIRRAKVRRLQFDPVRIE